MSFWEQLDDSKEITAGRSKNLLYELIQELINLGWSDNRKKQKGTLLMRWPPYTDLSSIAKFLIVTHDLLSIDPLEIKVKLQKE